MSETYLYNTYGDRQKWKYILYIVLAHEVHTYTVLFCPITVSVSYHGEGMDISKVLHSLNRSPLMQVEISIYA